MESRQSARSKGLFPHTVTLCAIPIARAKPAHVAGRLAKYQRRIPGFDEKIVSMHARGMSTREIVGHGQELYAIDVSPDFAKWPSFAT